MLKCLNIANLKKGKGIDKFITLHVVTCRNSMFVPWCNFKK